MVHFTPLQELGESQSAYCLFDQLILANPIFANSPRPLSEPEKEAPPLLSSVFIIPLMSQFQEKILSVFRKAEKEWKVMTLGDLVLNHTAANTPWLRDHPEATYNVTTAPHLRPALDLDLVCLYSLISSHCLYFHCLYCSYFRPGLY